jgi:hypothetical protein
MSGYDRNSSNLRFKMAIKNHQQKICMHERAKGKNYIVGSRIPRRETSMSNSVRRETLKALNSLGT